MTGTIAAGVIIGVVGGTLLGLGYFGGLKMTVDRLPVSRRPGLLFAGSFILRTIVVIAAFVLILRQSLPAFIAGFCAFVVVREVMRSRWKPDVNREGDHGQGRAP